MYLKLNNMSWSKQC